MWVTKSNHCVIVAKGDIASAHRHYEEFKRVFRYLRKNISYKAKVTLTTKFVRKVATSSSVVGNDILAVSLFNNSAEAFDYHVDENRLFKTIPGYVSSSGTKVMNIRIDHS